MRRVFQEITPVTAFIRKLVTRVFLSLSKIHVTSNFLLPLEVYEFHDGVRH